jgi:hypothetical protein
MVYRQIIKELQFQLAAVPVLNTKGNIAVAIDVPTSQSQAASKM